MSPRTPIATTQGAYTRELSRRFKLTLEVATNSMDNVDSIYTYDRHSYGVWLSYK